MSDTALIVIDVQESFRHAPYWSEEDVAPFVSTLQRLIDGAAAHGVPVLQVFHIEESGHFSLASGHVRTLAPLAIRPDVVFHKRRHSALIGSGLDTWLIRHRTRRVIVCGIRTEQCCETTTRHASDSGWEVDYVTEATLTFAMTAADGRRYPPEEIKAHTELVLADRFARIATVEEALSDAAMSAAA
ncbi:isochorismatase family protein [Lichenicola cladoniae]|uniref:Isochorismatase family protein n=1 Tax=Lichenicola cladoniae TaxID=1484109 RepID=A0A6M8HR52_9PROT|nr:isochorismatase family protein [Lichenicola cladoniae]NPD68845.1 isochorismatase family protein [Acetobacteraceae bacterium]QKE90737.1 isochorismatase family protein [Lichenicola cladoniae]